MHTLEQLATFIAVYEQGSYSAAAKLLGKSRTTVREHVMAFEDGVGYDLFIIDGRKAIPTEKASKLYFQAKVVDKQNRELHYFSQSLFDSDVHSLTVVHDVFAPLNLMVSIEKRVKEHYPNMVINWLHRTRQEALVMLKEGQADFALMPNRDMAFAETEVTWKTLGHLHLKCYAAKDSPLSAMEAVTIHHLQSETQYISENFLALNVGFAKISPRFHVVSNHDLLCEMIKQQGWAAMPEDYMQPYLKSGELVELKLKELPKSKMIGLNVFFAIGKDNQKVFADTIDWFVEEGHMLG
ncbi:LysR family transcriptional regulator [Enterovibrio makurazakiensis]|uniref:LysR family transcriptional regulator n=1 Tax=Enterovibrio makurazakiensis TaxID=2910232 RepID=UPI003D1A889F